MNDPKFVDKRQEPKPEKQKFSIYPTCATCKHFENFVMSDGRASQDTVCVYDPPQLRAQIRGEDPQGQVVWAVWASWPPVFPGQRCGKHAARDAN